MFYSTRNEQSIIGTSQLLCTDSINCGEPYVLSESMRIMHVYHLRHYGTAAEQINGLVLDWCISIANALEILQSCTELSWWSVVWNILPLPSQWQVQPVKFFFFSSLLKRTFLSWFTRFTHIFNGIALAMVQLHDCPVAVKNTWDPFY